MDLNTVNITGRLTTKPILRKKQNNGRDYCIFTIATQNLQKEACFFDCMCYDIIARNLVQSCDKGSRVIISGYLMSSRDKNGAQRVFISVRIVLNVNETQARLEQEKYRDEKEFKEQYQDPMRDIEINDEDLPF